ncbi:MAG: hypothetical protein AB1640_19620 [bacterium]
MGILIAVAGALLTSLSVLLIGACLKKAAARDAGIRSARSLVPRWMVAAGLLGLATFLAGLIITFGNLV